MPKAPDLKVLENYAGYKRISNVNELIKESKEQDNLALHCAAWRGLGYYHHYILFIISVSENIINITIIEKSNKNCSKLVPVHLVTSAHHKSISLSLIVVQAVRPRKSIQETTLLNSR